MTHQGDPWIIAKLAAAEPFFSGGPISGEMLPQTLLGVDHHCPKFKTRKLLASAPDPIMANEKGPAIPDDDQSGDQNNHRRHDGDQNRGCDHVEYPFPHSAKRSGCLGAVRGTFE